MNASEAGGSVTSGGSPPTEATSEWKPHLVSTDPRELSRPLSPDPGNQLAQLSKTAPSVEQIREVLEGCMYRGADKEASVDRELLEMCTLAELKVDECVERSGRTRSFADLETWWLLPWAYRRLQHAEDKCPLFPQWRLLHAEKRQK